MEFLRAYLEIEEARFGDRLNVQIDVAPDAAVEHIPSNILQPIVENALKHGLAPKVRRGYLWISARLEGDQVCLRVEDDGIGSNWATIHEDADHVFDSERKKNLSTGGGLRNIAERLDALYHSQARVSLEGRDRGGTCVTLLLPRSNGVEHS